MSGDSDGTVAPWAASDVVLSSPTMSGQQLSHQQLIEVAKEFGTPVYVYHAEKIAEQYKKLTTAFNKSNTRVFLCLQGADQYQHTPVYSIVGSKCRLQFDQ